MLPVRGVGLASVGGAGGLDITAGPIGEALEARRQGGARFWNKGGECSATRIRVDRYTTRVEEIDFLRFRARR